MNLLYPTSPKLKWYLPVAQQTCHAFQLVDISIEHRSKHSLVSPFPDGLQCSGWSSALWPAGPLPCPLYVLPWPTPPPAGPVNRIVQQMGWTRFPIARLYILYLCITGCSDLPLVARVHSYGRLGISTIPLPISNRRSPSAYRLTASNPYR
jgi:hypothetical protein